ncbi:MAG: hypothetical protein HOV84_10100 [Streptomyces sp.]|nr:hypothetical protein [Streptomyces sp.]
MRKEAVLASGARIRFYTGKPAWDPAQQVYSWAEATLPGKGRVWLRTEQNEGDGINIITPLAHPRSYRDTSGTTGMFLHETSRYGVVYANGACVTDGTQTACVTASYSEVKPAGPCEGWCSDADPTAIAKDDWSYVSRPDYRRVQLPSGAWVQHAEGRLKQGSYLNWAEGALPGGGRIWLESWQGTGRWGEVWTEFTPTGASRTTSGSTRAYSWLPTLRACVRDSSGTACTSDADAATTAPTQAPCAKLPCEGIDPASVTEWMPNYDPSLLEDANIYLGGRLKIYEGRPAWDPYHLYYWGEAELPPGATGVSATLMTHAAGGSDSREKRPEAIPGARLTASGKTKMFALDPLSAKKIAGLVVDGKNWSFATRQGNNMSQTDVEGPVGPCAPGSACDGILPGSVTKWSSPATDWATAALPSGKKVTLRGGKPNWSVTDYYAWAHSTATDAPVWLEDRQPDGTYSKVATTEMKATTGQQVRACISEGTTTVCTKPLS